MTVDTRSGPVLCQCGRAMAPYQGQVCDLCWKDGNAAFWAFMLNPTSTNEKRFYAVLKRTSPAKEVKS